MTRPLGMSTIVGSGRVLTTLGNDGDIDNVGVGAVVPVQEAPTFRALTAAYKNGRGNWLPRPGCLVGEFDVRPAADIALAIILPSRSHHSAVAFQTYGMGESRTDGIPACQRALASR